jgi:hypothetical protein
MPRFSQNKLILRATPNPWSATQGLTLYNGSDGFLYDQNDVPFLTRMYGEPKTRRTKYGTSLYFERR